MTKRFGIDLIVVILCTLTASAQSINKQEFWTVETMMKVAEPRGPQVSPDGKFVAYANSRLMGDMDAAAGARPWFASYIHISSTNGRNSMQATYGDHTASLPRWSPDSKSIAFLSHLSGQPNVWGKANIWLLPLHNGQAYQITNCDVDVLSFKWSPNGRQIAFVAADSDAVKKSGDRKEGRPFDVMGEDEDAEMLYLWLVDMENTSTPQRGRKLISSASSLWPNWTGCFDWSPDGKTIAFSHGPKPSEAYFSKLDISVIDVSSGRVTPLVNSGRGEFNPIYSPDGNWIAYLAADNPFSVELDFTVHVIPAKGGEARQLAATYDRHPTLLGWSAESAHIYVQEYYHTLSRLYAIPLDDQPPLAVNLDDKLFLSDASVSGQWAGMVLESLDAPPEVYVSRINAYHPTKVSSLNDWSLKIPLGHTEVIQWKSVDGLQIEGLLTYPIGYQSNRQYPLVVVAHGGPQSLFTQSFTGRFYRDPYPISVLNTRGYLVLRPNIRGSDGYGKDFRFANQFDMGGKDFEDLLAGVDHVLSLGVADSNRVGIMGWSYGGFMAATAITRTNRFKAASVGASPVNWTSIAGGSEYFGVALPNYFNGEFWDSADRYLRLSPIYHVKGVSTPTLIQHSKFDSWIPVSQAIELYNALKRQGCVVKLVIFHQWHWPLESYTLPELAGQNIEWFDRYLNNEAGLKISGSQPK